MSSGAKREPTWASRRLFLTWTVLLLFAAILNIVAQVTAGQTHHHRDLWETAALALFIISLAAPISDRLLKHRMKRRGVWPAAATGPIAREPIDYSVPPPKDGSLFTGRADQAPLQEWLRRRRQRRSAGR